MGVGGGLAYQHHPFLPALLILRGGSALAVSCRKRKILTNENGA